MAENINIGWLTDFNDVKFVPKTLFSQVFLDNGASATSLTDYFRDTINAKTLLINLGSNTAAAFNADNSGASQPGVTGTLAVKNGGTGLNTIKANSLLLGNGTDAVKALEPVSSGSFLVDQGANKDPKYVRLAASWSTGPDNGPKLKLTFSDITIDGYEFAGIPYASDAVAGVVSTKDQLFAGKKTFNGGIVVNTQLTIGANGEVSMGNHRIQNVADPTAATDAATKNYVATREKALQDQVTAISNIVGTPAGSVTGTHESRIVSLTNDVTNLDDRLDNFDAVFGGLDSDALYILDGSNDIADECNVIAYFDKLGFHAAEIYVGTDKYTDQMKNVTDTGIANTQNIVTIFNILGESATVGTGHDHKSQLDSLRSDLNQEIANRQTADNDVKGEINAQTLQVSLSTLGAQAINTGTIGITNTLGISNGGTGTTSFTANGVLYGGTNQINATAAGTNGQILISDSTGTPKFIDASINGTYSRTADSYMISRTEGTVKTSSMSAATSTLMGLITATDQSFGGVKTFTDVTDSTKIGTGAIIINGGTSIAKQLRVGDNITTSGDLTVYGGDIYFGTAEEQKVTITYSRDTINEGFEDTLLIQFIEQVVE